MIRLKALLKEYQSEPKDYSRIVILRPPPTEGEIETIAHIVHHITKNNTLHDFTLKIGISTDSDMAIIELERRHRTTDVETVISHIECWLAPPITPAEPAFDIKTTSILLRD